MQEFIDLLNTFESAVADRAWVETEGWNDELYSETQSALDNARKELLDYVESYYS
jgi:hypothetical protein